MKIVLGTDEVGRGCWAGPLVAGAVILNQPIAGLRDSKKLSALQRSKLATIINDTATVGLGWVTPQEVDHLGLTKAVGLAMQRAVDQITAKFDQLIVDGNYNYFSHDPRAEAMIKADDHIPAVSAASIVAKVARDTFMQEIALQYPHYGFEHHVGYGTAQHLKSLQEHGITAIHRLSYKPIMTILALA